MRKPICSVQPPAQMLPGRQGRRLRVGARAGAASIADAQPVAAGGEGGDVGRWHGLQGGGVGRVAEIGYAVPVLADGCGVVVVGAGVWA